MASLTTKILNSLGWILSNVLAKNGIQVVRRIVLWQFLDAAAFGLNATVWMVINTLDMLRDMGFANALLQRKGDLQSAISVTFWTNLVIHLSVYGVIVAVAPAVAAHFAEPELVPLLRYTGIIVLLRAFGKASFVLLQKEFRFKAILYINVTEMVTTTAAILAFAATGYGVWSFVWGTMIGTVFRNVASWIARPVRVGKFDLRVAKEMFDFAKHMTISTLALMLIRNMPIYFVGKFLGMSACGFYVEAERLAGLVATNVTRLLGSILFPAFSEIGENYTRVRRAWGTAVRYVTILIMPLGLGMVLFSREILLGFYPDVLEVAIVPMSVLALFSVFRGVASTLSDVSKGVGKPWTLTRSAMVHAILMAPCLLVSVVAPRYFGDLVGLLGQLSLPEYLLLRLSLTLSEVEAGIAFASLAVSGTAVISVANLFALCHREVGITVAETRAALRPALWAGLGMGVCAILARGGLYATLAELNALVLASGSVLGAALVTSLDNFRYPLVLGVGGALAFAAYAAILHFVFPEVASELLARLRRRATESPRKKKGKRVEATV